MNNAIKYHGQDYLVINGKNTFATVTYVQISDKDCVLQPVR